MYKQNQMLAISESIKHVQVFAKNPEICLFHWLIYS